MEGDFIDEIFGACDPVGGDGRNSSSLLPSAAAGGSRPVVSSVEEARNAATADDGKDAVVPTTPMASLACRVMTWFRDNASARRNAGVDEKLEYALRVNRLKFSHDQQEVLLREFSKEIVERVFVPISSTKARAAKSMLYDLVNQGGEPLFRIEPTSVPEVPEEVALEAQSQVFMRLVAFQKKVEESGVQSLGPEEMSVISDAARTLAEEMYDSIEAEKDEFAKTRARRMQRKVADMFEEGGFDAAFAKYLDNICVFGTGVIVVTPRNDVKNEFVGKGEKRKYSQVLRTRMMFESVNPMDCYPAPDASEIDEGPLCIRVKYAADALWRFSRERKDARPDGRGWICGAVDDLLRRHPSGGVKIAIESYSAERRFCEMNGFEDVTDCTFEGVRCFAAVRGTELLGMGVYRTMDGDGIEPDRYYRTETIVIDNRVVYCRIYPDELGVPVCKGVFYTVPGAWWGDSIADKVAMCQTTLNNTAISLMRNMPVSSGGIFYIADSQRLQTKTPNLKIRSGMTLTFSGSSMAGSSGAPVGVMTVPSVANELMAVWAKMQTQADIDSGLPGFTEGQSSGQAGALRTASGLAMYTENSTRGMKMTMTITDKSVIARSARICADWVLLYDKDEDLKGDVSIRPVGLIGRILKAQRDQMRQQLLDMAQRSPSIMQLVGMRGLAALMRPSIRDTDENPDDILPSKAKIEEQDALGMLQQALQASAAQSGVQQNLAAAVGGAQDVPQGTEPQPGGGAAPIADEGPAPGTVAERRNAA